MQPLEVSQSILEPYSARILLGTCGSALSVVDLSQRFGIPIAACYRRIRQLERMGLVACERVLPSRNGKGLQLFRSRVKSVRVRLEDGRLTASVILEDGATPRSAEQVLSLGESSTHA